ncbi:unnamed protein product [Calicophoron daubneyi]|uniref:Protein FAM161A n=1 Tax=Calicophoron daubneyi TaxID=300641 RepID=A0AAV2TRU3_CALDB
MSLARINVSLDHGFQKENQTLRNMSSSAKTVLQELLSVTSGDLSQTAKLLDDILNETQQKIKELTEDESITDEEFYERLSCLRSEHKDTLDMIEKLYLKSCYEPVTQKSVELTGRSKETASVACRDVSEPYGHNFESESKREQVGSRTYELPSTFGRRSMPADFGCGVRDIGHWATEFEEPANADRKDNEFSERFSEHSNWRHHVTIPKPFEMIKREEERKRSGRMTRSMCDMLAERQAKEAEEQEECAQAGRFRARPIPAHVYLPLYDQLREQEAIRREAARAHSREVLKAMEKPFKFTLRERHRKENTSLLSASPSPEDERARSASAPAVQKRSLKKVNTATDTLDLPDQVYESRLERMREAELLREVKRHLRAERLLQSASYPAGMEERMHRAELRKAERMERTKRIRLESGLDDPDDIERINRMYRAKPAPDFKQLHWKNDKALRRIWKPPPEPTHPKPFRFYSARRASQRMAKKEERRRSRSSSARSSGRSRQSRRRTHSASAVRMEAPPPVQARTSVLRESMVRRSLERARMEEEKSRELEKARRMHQLEVSRKIRTSFPGSDEDPKVLIDAITERRKHRMAHEISAREAEYKRELNAIKKRVATQPLLITRQSQNLARKQAEAKFASVLQNAGLDPNEFVLQEKNKPGEVRRSINCHRPDIEAYDPSNHFGDLDNRPF